MNTLYWQNTHDSNLEGEIWESAFGFDGIYEVSNKGRIRSLTRYVNTNNGRQRLMKGRILSQVKVIHSHSGNFSLYVRLANGDGSYSNKTIASLVLNSFKKPDAYNNCTHHINGIAYDNRLENLTFEDIKTKRRIEYDLGVRNGVNNTKHWKESGHLKRRSEDFYFVRNKLAGGNKRTYEMRNKKPVTVFIRETKFIASYSSIKNASEQLNIPQHKLRNALSKSDKYKNIQVKEGIFNLETFNPTYEKRTTLTFVVNKDRYSTKDFSIKFNISQSTLYHRNRNYPLQEFEDWLKNKISVSVYVIKN